MFRRLERHQAYRTTNLSWLNEVPSHWELKRNKALLSEARELVGESSATTQLLALTKRGVVTRDMGNLGGKVPASFDTYQHLDAGDLIFCLFDIDETPRTVGLVPESGMITGAYTRMRVGRSASAAYLAHYYTVLDDQKALRPLYTGLRKSIRTDAFLAVETPVPPADEQAAIVKYLGHAHARIDRAIAVKRKLIALLEEQKQAVIHQAVTCGLDPTMPLKDSGIPWLRKIPAHWGVTRAKHLFTEFDRRSGTGAQRLLSLRASAGLVYHDEVSTIPIGPAALEKYKVVSPGDFVMNRMRAASGLFAIAMAPGLVSPDYSTMTVDSSADADFYLRLFKTQAAMAEFKRRSTGLGTGEAGFMRLYSDGFGRVPLPLPPIEEQRAIVSALDAELGRSAAVATKASNEIELLREFRTRLTSDVVTGQVDVREIAAALPELSDDMLARDSDQAEDSIEDAAEEFLEGDT